MPRIKYYNKNTNKWEYADSKYVGRSVDLTGYATEEFVQDGFQPKGDYLTEVPDGYATEEWVQEGYQIKGEYLTEHQDISGKLDANKLPEAINAALAQAKESGEFDGEDYVLTDGDKAEIAEIAAALVDVPEGSGGGSDFVADTLLSVTTTERVKYVEQELTEPKNYKYLIYRIGNYSGHADNSSNNYTAQAIITFESGTRIFCDINAEIKQGQSTTKLYANGIVFISPSTVFCIGGSNVNAYNGVTLAGKHYGPVLYTGDFSGKIKKVGFGVNDYVTNTAEVGAVIEIFGVR